MYWNKYHVGAYMSNMGLTLTWDVLKWFSTIKKNFEGGQININMRCIEMKILIGMANLFRGLTLTWDVLKWSQCTEVRECRTD